MSSTDDVRPPRRPQPDRDSFYDRHARRPAPTPAATGDDLPETIILPGTAGAQLPTVEFSQKQARHAAPEPAAARRTAPESAAAGPAAAESVPPTPMTAGAATSDDAPVAETPATRAFSAVPPTAETPTTVPPTADTPTVVTPLPDSFGTGQAPAEPSATGRAAATRTDVRTVTDTVVTEPFADTDDERDEAAAAQKRRAAEHLTEDPLPYIEPQHTAPLVIDDGVPASVPSAAYSDVPAGAYSDYDDAPAGAAPVRRGTLDLGLLILRVVVGLVFFFHGLQKLTTWRGGFGVDGFAGYLTNSADPSLGFKSDAAHTLALVGGLSETIGGVLLVLGLLTPIAGSAVLGVIIVALTYKATLAGGLWFFAGQGGGNGLEYEIVLAAAAIAIILCGSGTYSLDRRWGWSRRPAWGSVAWLIIAIAGAVAIWIVFNGANPLARA